MLLSIILKFESVIYCFKNQAPELILNYLDIYFNIIYSFQALAKIAGVGPWKVTCNYNIFIKCIRKAKDIVFIYGNKFYGNKEIKFQLESPKCNLSQKSKQ